MSEKNRYKSQVSVPCIHRNWIHLLPCMRSDLRWERVRMCLLGLLILVIHSCKKESRFASSCPCVAGDNIVFQEDFDPIPPDWIYYNTDTVSSTIVKFIAPVPEALSYTWTIESATYHSPNVRLQFPADYLVENKQLPVKLSIHYTTALGLDTVQSFKKMLSFANPCVSQFNGTFVGTTDYGITTDSFKIATCAGDGLHPGGNFYLDNYQLHCSRYFDEYPDSYNIGFKELLFSASGDLLCNSPSGIITVNGDSIHMQYRSYDNGLLQAPLDHLFKGVKK